MIYQNAKYAHFLEQKPVTNGNVEEASLPATEASCTKPRIPKQKNKTAIKR